MGIERRFRSPDEASSVAPCAFVTVATIHSLSPTPPLSRERDLSAR
jgi:hypothetical protein